MQYFDMHSHILPNFDDGARTVDDSLELLDCLKKQNVSNVCLTPHFYTNQMSVESFIEKRKAFLRFSCFYSVISSPKSVAEVEPVMRTFTNSPM